MLLSHIPRATNSPPYPEAADIPALIVSLCHSRLLLLLLLRCVVSGPGDHGGRHSLPRRPQRHHQEPVLRRLQHAAGAPLSVSKHKSQKLKSSEPSRGNVLIDLHRRKRTGLLRVFVAQQRPLEVKKQNTSCPFKVRW